MDHLQAETTTERPETIKRICFETRLACTVYVRPDRQKIKNKRILSVHEHKITVNMSSVQVSMIKKNLKVRPEEEFAVNRLLDFRTLPNVIFSQLRTDT